MSTEPKSVFLMVRSHAHLKRANKEAAAFLSILRRRSSIGEFDSLQGIWVDPQGVANLPRALELPEPGRKQLTNHTVESIGLNGIWMLCWFETAEGTVSRVDLVSALLECMGHEDLTHAEAHFIPVIDDDGPVSDWSDDLHALEARYPQLLQPPVSQSSGEILFQPSALLHQEVANF